MPPPANFRGVIRTCFGTLEVADLVSRDLEILFENERRLSAPEATDELHAYYRLWNRTSNSPELQGLFIHRYRNFGTVSIKQMICVGLGRCATQTLIAREDAAPVPSLPGDNREGTHYRVGNTSMQQLVLRQHHKYPYRNARYPEILLPGS